MRLAPVLLAGALALAGCGKSETSAEAPATGEPAADTVAVTPTAAMGEQVFRRCVACHTIDKGGANGIGPNLHGVVGRAVASHPDFSYSGAMKAKGGVWDEAALNTYLEAPMKAVPGTRMAFAGVIDAADRKALILYLEEQSK
ncbi:cytochrome c [Sphingopyxis sp. OAS728]|uniref:c-type cytochrome n=1 Tax=Sphingopyxis sp. OAS728 TaxID=2663823 RepID=UPI0017897AE6|nr:cytochrome c family protein [Sphingopyxis sp. OAS728]MBE1529257.1 cytochrome c [Sphingopyxis sp. OAS728]